MMELTIYAVVLGVISLVTATPSGYNTKSGAVAGGMYKSRDNSLFIFYIDVCHRSYKTY